MFRWSTVVLTGCWRRSHQGALTDALRARHAEMLYSEVILHDFVRIEQKGQDCSPTEIPQQLAA